MRRRRRLLLLAVLSGALLGWTFSPHGGPVLPFLAFAPLALALAAPRHDRGSRRPSSLAPMALGFATAAVSHGVGLYWMVPALSWRTPLAVPIYLLVLTLIGVVAGAACQAAVFIHGRARWPLPLALACCWTGFEWVAARAPGVPYAWLNAGQSLVWHPSLAAGAELLGARLMAFWTVMVGAAVAALVASGGAARARSAVAIVALVAVPAIGGAARQAGLDAEEAGAGNAVLPGESEVLRVAAVQTGRAQGGLAARGRNPDGIRWALHPRWTAAHFVASCTNSAAIRAAKRLASPAQRPSRCSPEFLHGLLEAWLDPLEELHAMRPLDLVAFPERHLPALLRDPGTERPTETGARVAEFARILGIPVVIGALDAEVLPAGTRDTLWYNAAFLQSPDGTLSAPYRKERLVPGVEGTGWAGLTLGTLSRGYTAGRGSRPLALVHDGDSSPSRGRPGAPTIAPASVMICYDSAFEATARELVGSGAGWLLVISNDDWLAPQRPFRTTWAYWQHATHARLRAVEHRVPVVQVAATGHTFAVSAAGRVARQALGPGERGVVVAEVTPSPGGSLYTRTGDLLGLACFTIFALAMAWRAIGRPLDRLA